MQRHAPHDTRLGRLQRGRGSGFLLALQTPSTARDELLRCILDDPRGDVQTESRSRYYAELAVRLGVRAAPIVECAVADASDWLAVDVLAEMAARGDADALALLGDAAAEPDVATAMLCYLRDYPHWTAANVPLATVDQLAEQLHEADELLADVEIYGEFWHPWAARLPRVAAAFVDAAAAAAAAAVAAPQPVDDPTALSIDLLLANLDAQASVRIAAELSRRTSPSDRALLALRVQHDDSFGRVRAAAGALADMGDLRLLDLAEDLFGRGDDPHDPTRALDAADQQRRHALLWYFRSLPPNATLPLARRWWHRGGFFRTAAGKVLAQHAEPRDREWLEDHVQRALLRSGAVEIGAEIEALARIADARSLPVLLSAIERTTCSWTRSQALRGLADLAHDPRTHAELTEALWDCEEEARALGCAHCQLDPSARHRLAELARDPIEDDSVRRAAATRTHAVA